MVFSKNNRSSFFSKGNYEKLIGASKGIASVLDNGLVQAGITALAPEIGAGLSAASRAGLLQKIKNS
jgi:hypothetical protein